MKKIFILLTALATFVFAQVAGAQTINDKIKDKAGSTLQFPNDTGVQIDNENKVAYSKNISKPFSDGTYWIKLETFATGTAEKVVSSTPSDIILVLDLSSSMGRNNYTIGGQSMTRLQALRQVIRDFAITVYDNDAKARSVDSQYLGDRIAVIGYDRNASMISNGGWVYINDTDKGVTKTGDTYGGTLLTAISGMNGDAGTGTRPDHGFDMAITELLSGNTDATKKRADANLTVLMFTDGYPTDNNATQLGEPTTGGNENKFEYPIANKALYYANQLKKTYGASLYTIGLINPVAQADSWQYRNYCRVRQWMDWLSSNYPDAKWADGVITSTTQMFFESATDDEGKIHYSGYPGGDGTSFVLKGANVPDPWSREWAYNAGSISVTGFEQGTTETDGDKFTNDGDYCQIVDDNTDFTSIFESISMQAAGTANESLSPQASNMDMISNSFILPDEINADNVDEYVLIFTQKLTDMDGDGTEGDDYIFGEPEILAPNNDYEYPVYNSYGVQTDTKDIDEDIEVNLVGTNGIKVTGFDYAANFCGPVTDENGNFKYYQGYKIIIMIPINMNPDAVGGPNTPTNGTGSGIYAEGSDTPLVEFKSPTVSLPVNIFIEKEGLSGRESAKFKIERAIIPEGGVQTNENGIITNIADDDWEYVSTVFVTNSPNSKHNPKTNNPWVKVKGMPATKMVDGVQKGLVYRVTEENWSWSYTPKTIPQYTITEKIDNPFTFKNEKRTEENIDVTVRHAESKATNTFKSGETLVKYDDSKENEGRESSGPAGMTTSGSN